jgi:hypothetical protein
MMAASETYWINGWWTNSFSHAKQIAAQHAGVAGYDHISVSEDGTPEKLTQYASLVGGHWSV